MDRLALALIPLVWLLPSPSYGQLNNLSDPVHSITVAAIPRCCEELMGEEGEDSNIGAEGFASALGQGKNRNNNDVVGAVAARTTGGPHTFVEIRLNLTGDGLRLEAHARLLYSLMVNEDATPPEAVSTVPVKMDYLLSADAFDVDEFGFLHGRASLEIRREDRSHVFSDIISIFFPQQFEQSGCEVTGEGCVDVEMNIDEVYEVDMRGSASLEFGDCCDRVGQLNVDIDPVFTFDQARFDEVMGANTFPLADFFSFEFSPGISNGIPEPTVSVLVLAAAICLVGRRNARAAISRIDSERD